MRKSTSPCAAAFTVALLTFLSGCCDDGDEYSMTCKKMDNFLWVQLSIGATNNALAEPALTAERNKVKAAITVNVPVVGVEPNTKKGATFWYVYTGLNGDEFTYTIKKGAGVKWKICDHGQCKDMQADFPSVPMTRPLHLTIAGSAAVNARNQSASPLLVEDLRVCQSDVDIAPSQLAWSSSQYQSLPWQVLIATPTSIPGSATVSLAMSPVSGTKSYYYVRQRFVDTQAVRQDICHRVVVGDLPSIDAQNRFEIYPDRAGASTSFVTRCSLGVGAGEVLQEVPAALFRGVGDNGAATGCTFRSMQVVVQDQDGATPESMDFVVRRSLANGSPDPSAAGVVISSAAVNLPTYGSGPVGWIVTWNFATPVELPCDTGFCAGVALRAAPAWTNDGLAVHSAFYAPNGTLGDNPRAGAPNHTWQIIAGSASPAASGRVLRVVLGVEAPVLNLGNVDPTSLRSPGGASFGAGGMYPDVANAPRRDGLRVRIGDTANLGGLALVFLSTNVGPGLSAELMFQGRLWLDPTVLIQVGSAPIVATGTPVAGIADLSVLPPGALGPAARGYTLFLQSLTVSGSFTNLRMSNAQGVSF